MYIVTEYEPMVTKAPEAVRAAEEFHKLVAQNKFRPAYRMSQITHTNYIQGFSRCGLLYVFQILPRGKNSWT